MGKFLWILGVFLGFSLLFNNLSYGQYFDFQSEVDDIYEDTGTDPSATPCNLDDECARFGFNYFCGSFGRCALRTPSGPDGWENDPGNPRAIVCSTDKDCSHFGSPYFCSHIGRCSIRCGVSTKCASDEDCGHCGIQYTCVSEGHCAVELESS